MERAAIYTNSMQAADYLARCASLDVHICGGIDEDGEVYSDNVAVATAESAILHNAVHKYVLCDSTKLGKKSVAHIYNLNNCDTLITGKNDTLATEALACICNIIFV